MSIRIDRQELLALAEDRLSVTVKMVEAEYSHHYEPYRPGSPTVPHLDGESVCQFPMAKILWPITCNASFPN